MKTNRLFEKNKHRHSADVAAAYRIFSDGNLVAAVQNEARASGPVDRLPALKIAIEKLSREAGLRVRALHA